MDVKMAVLVLIAIAAFFDMAAADLLYNRPLPNASELEELGLKCIPGRTVIRVTEKVNLGSVDSGSEEFMRRKKEKPALFRGGDESCSICICSVDGNNEACIKRPASSVNECITMKRVAKQAEKNEPYEHMKSLSFRIRRDLMWHNDEIPYDPRSRCYRGHSYYTNHDNPNDTDINYNDEVNSLLDFKSNSSCFYCVCSVSGQAAGCISRHLWFCNYLRYLRSDMSSRDMYANLFVQDRPSYFRQLSWRIRRSLDNSLFDLIEEVGDSDQDEQNERDKNTKTCIPLVSEYTDCTPANECTGCTKCICSPAGQWECRSIHQCDAFHTDEIDEELFDAAVEKLDYELKSQKRATHEWKRTAEHQKPKPVPKKDASDELLDLLNTYKAQQKRLNKRQKRSVMKRNASDKRAADKTTKNVKPVTNHTVKFYSTVDELNEDTLRNSNISGTLNAQRVDLSVSLDASRRSNADNNNKSLQIDFNKPHLYSHITDNKIDTDHEKFESHEKQLNIIHSNHTQKEKDKDLSKLVVNELKPGSEIIGDKYAPVTSNITFTPENDTLTAMAFIAGNLLKKLWNMEKDAKESSWETDDMKQEKIADLLDLFKEPLNLRQEAFLKNALQHLSSALDKNKDVTNVSLCETIEEAKKIIDFTKIEEDDNTSANIPTFRPPVINNDTKQRRKNDSSEEKKNKRTAAIKAISKINKVLLLLKKYENVQKNLSSLMYGPDTLQLNDTTNFTAPILKLLNKDNIFTEDESVTLNLFGNLLDKVTKLVLPKGKQKAMSAELKQKNFLASTNNFKSHFKNMYGINIENMTVTAKDKLLLDYIEHINSNPDCLTGKKNPDKSLPVIEGNILLNLSEFFKMKTFADLFNLLNLGKNTDKKNSHATSTTTEAGVTSSIVASIPTKNMKLASTKERLKFHLKSIMEDIIELQNTKGAKLKGNLRVAEALPCIYNIMKSKEIFGKNGEINSEVDRIIDIFQGLKQDMKISQSRRAGPIMQIRPKSAVILERVIQNFAEKSDLKTRRFLEVEVKPFDELKYMIKKMQNISSLYKTQALFTEVPAAEKLMLFKALAEDVKNYIFALEQIKVAFQNTSQLSPKQFNELAVFVVNSIKNITLNAKVIKKVEAEVVKKPTVDEVDMDQIAMLPKVPLAVLRRGQDNNDDSMVITRNQIINHLIRNRINMYIKLKEAQDIDMVNDLNYNIAKKIIFYMDRDNYNLAHELFKSLLKQKHDGFEEQYIRDLKLPTPRKPDIPIRQDGITHIQPLIQFEEPKVTGDQMKWLNQDHLIKQLLNIKNMGL